MGDTSFAYFACVWNPKWVQNSSDETPVFFQNDLLGSLGPLGSLGSLGSVGPLGFLGVPGTSASFGFVRGAWRPWVILLLLILGAFGIQNGFQTHVTKLPFFSKNICRNAKLDILFWFVLGFSGALAVPFLHHFGGPWGPNGLLFE